MIRIAAFIIAVSAQSVSAACTDFEREVYELIRDAQTFQTTDVFFQYGWSPNGPFGEWLDRWKVVRDQDKELHGQFLRKFDYVPGDLYSVADAHRTGSYDDFWAQIENKFLEGPVCN